MSPAGPAGDPGVHGHAPLLIGLTGPIGCGKSTVAGWLVERGAIVVDADRLARAVTEPGSAALAEIAARFGPDILRPDGTLDRGALGRIVFADPGALVALESIVHPAVRPRILEALRNAAAQHSPAVVLEAIKLVEAGYPALLDEVWLVSCTPAEQEQRLIGRGMTVSDARQRMAAQAGMAERVVAAASRLIDTSGPAEAARRRVHAALAEALADRAARPG